VLWPEAQGRKHRNAAKDTKKDTRYKDFTFRPLQDGVAGEGQIRGLAAAAYHCCNFNRKPEIVKTDNFCDRLQAVATSGFCQHFQPESAQRSRSALSKNGAHK